MKPAKTILALLISSSILALTAIKASAQGVEISLQGANQGIETSATTAFVPNDVARGLLHRSGR